MTELGELEKNWQEFKKRNVKVVVVSLEGVEEAKATQEDFRHLVVVSDAERKLSEAIEIIHQKSSPKGEDTAAPTTLLIDGDGIVRWKYHPPRVFDRLSPDQLLAAIDKEMPAK
jgi:peroxiredoxin